MKGTFIHLVLSGPIHANINPTSARRIGFESRSFRPESKQPRKTVPRVPNDYPWFSDESIQPLPSASQA
jgi:hypothetical protein